VKTRQLAFTVHGWLGVTLGLVLAVMGLTGSAMSFQDEIIAALASRFVTPGVPVVPDLSPDRLRRRIEATQPGYRVDRLDWEMDRTRSHAVRLVPAGGGNGGRRSGRVDRATGAWLPEPGIVPAFDTVENVHRWLALPGKGNGPGRQITGLAAIALLVFMVTGLAVRWPRTRRQWQRFLVLDLHGNGSVWRKAHRVIGTWLIPCYLLSAATGLWWSYDWYRSAATRVLTGKPVPASKPAEGGQKVVEFSPLDPSWRTFVASGGGRYAWVRITMGADGRTIAFDARTAAARHAKMTDRYTYDVATGRMSALKRYDQQSTSAHIAAAMLEVHRGAFFGLSGRIAILLSTLCLPAFATTGVFFWFKRRRSQTKVAQRRINDTM
jgi:sulfite reductase (NADPH) flavoprotein alpha-component